MKKTQYLFVGVVFMLLTIGISIYWAYGTPQTNVGLSQTQVAQNTYNSTYGAEQVTILAQIATSPQTNTGMSLTQFARNIFDSTYGAKQVILSTSTGKQVPFINTTSLTQGDLLFYDATGVEWDNTQEQISISGIGSSPVITLKNPTAEDIEGGRESAMIVKGLQSGSEETTLAKIQISHDGTGDDEKGDIIFYTNDGSDSNTPTERMRIDSAGEVQITNDNWLTSVDNAGTSVVNMAKVNTSDQVELGADTIIDDFKQGSLNRWATSESVADDASITTLAAINSPGFGFVSTNDGAEYCFFTFSADGGTITLIASSANCTNTDTDTDLCVIDSGGNGIHIKNRFGSEQTVIGWVQW